MSAPFLRAMSAPFLRTLSCATSAPSCAPRAPCHARHECPTTRATSAPFHARHERALPARHERVRPARHERATSAPFTTSALPLLCTTNAPFYAPRVRHESFPAHHERALPCAATSARHECALPGQLSLFILCHPRAREPFHVRYERVTSASNQHFELRYSPEGG
jgi:hypothetical protein